MRLTQAAGLFSGMTQLIGLDESSAIGCHRRGADCVYLHQRQVLEKVASCVVFGIMTVAGGGGGGGGDDRGLQCCV